MQYVWPFKKRTHVRSTSALPTNVKLLELTEQSMKLRRRQFLHLAVCTAAISAQSRIAWALDYPSRPVRIIAGFAAGGGVDITARLIGQWLSARLGQSFITENRPGADGNIGTEVVVNARPDGYTLLLTTVPNAVNATLYQKLNFSISFATSRRSRASSACPWSCSSIHRYRPRPSQSSSPMPKPILARSTWHRRVPA